MKRPRLLIEALNSYGRDREDRLTEVLACALGVHAGFCQLLLAEVGVRGRAARFEIRAQEGFDGQRRLVDLVIRGLDARGRTVATVFAEHKYNPEKRFDAYWFTEEQWRRQRAALDGQIGETRLIGIASAFDLRRLDGPVELRPPFDPRLRYDPLLSWDQIKNIARRAGGPEGWETDALRPDAPAAQRLLLECLTYLEMEGMPMGALEDDDVFVLARVATAKDRINRILSRAADELAVKYESALEDEDFSSDESSRNGAWRTWVAVDPPANTWLVDRTGANLSLMMTTARYEEEDPSVGTPHVYAGICWSAGRDGRQAIVASTWENTITRNEFKVRWEGTDCCVYGERPLTEFLAGDTLVEQAKSLADWAQSQIAAALQLPAPPDPDLAPRTKLGASPTA